MDEIIKKAYSGNRASVNALYNDNKNKVYSIAMCLLDNKSKAENVVLNIFSKIWKEFDKLKIETEDDFSEICRSRATMECKKIILREDSRAFAVPKNQNMMINSEKTNFSVSDKVSLWKEATSEFSTLHKYIFVSRTLCKMSLPQIAKAVNVDEGTVGLAVKAEDVYFGKTISFSDVEKSIFAYAETLQFAPSDLSVVINSIDEYVTPFEKNALIGKIRVLSAVLVVAVIVAVVVLLITIIGGGNSENVSSGSSSSSEDIEPKWESSVTATDYAVIDIKNYGKISIALDGKTAPITVENFKKLAKKGFYDGLTFHRIMENFMMQGGDPDANGTGGSDEEIKGEFYANGVENNIGHFRGAISMARSNPMDSASSQFFIVHKDSPHLNGKYAAFGFVVDGIEIVDKVCKDAKPTDDNGTIPFANQPIINSVKIYSVEEFKNISDTDESKTSSETDSEIVSNENSETASETVSNETSENVSETVSDLASDNK